MVFMNFGILNTYSTRVGDDFVNNFNVSIRYPQLVHNMDRLSSLGRTLKTMVCIHLISTIDIK